MKLLFDECIGYGIYRSLIPALDAYRPPVARAHMLDFTGRQGVPDEEWVPRAASEGWIVVTGDSGRSRLGAPLQELMPAHGVTGIYFSGKLQSRPAKAKADAILAVLDRLPEIAGSPRGARYRVAISGTGYALRPWPLRNRPL